MIRHALWAMLLAVAAAAPGCRDAEPQSPPAADPTPAKEIQAEYWLNSEPLTLAALRGKIVVLEFWATWCPPCRTTIPHLIDLHETYGPKGVVFVSLTNEPRPTVEPFANDMKMTYPVGGGSTSGGDYGVERIPSAFLIDRTGMVVWSGYPMSPEMVQAIEAQLKAAPQEAG